MPTAPLYNQDGQATSQVELDPKIFAVKPNRGLIEQAVVTLLANRRRPIAHTKTKGEVRGGGRKPWRQKGTGRARQGSIRSPQWKGGGVIFGPRSNRNYAKKMNLKDKRLALRMVLSSQAEAKRVMIVDQIKLPALKTKQLASQLKKLPVGRKPLIILPTTDRELVRTGRNIPDLMFIRADSLNVYDLLNHSSLLIYQSALPIISKLYTA
jgi:large subunit ribosomal protein L4